MIIYLTTQGTTVNLKDGRIVIREPAQSGVMHSVPKEQVRSFALFGQIHLSTSIISHCLMRGIPVSFFSKTGKYFGKLYTTSHNNIFRAKKQIYASDDLEFSLALAKNIILAKVNNQLTILRRYERSFEKNKKEIRDIVILRKKISQADSMSVLLGYEGTIARIYFRALSNLIQEKFKFKNRNRRPPRDPFNSLISLGYSILLNEIVGNLEAVGLNPYCGFLHQDHERHMTLASDMIEELRAPLIDSLALNFCNGDLEPADFIYENNGCYLKPELLKKFLAQLEKKMMTKQNYREDEYAMTFRKSMGLQARDLVRAIEEKDPSVYKPLWIR